MMEYTARRSSRLRRIDKIKKKEEEIDLLFFKHK